MAHSLRSLARFSSCRQLDVEREAFVGRHAVARAALQLLGPLANPSQPEAGSHRLLDRALAIVMDAELHQAVVAERQLDLDVRGVGVLADVGERFERGAMQGERDRGADRPRRAGDRRRRR